MMITVQELFDNAREIFDTAWRIAVENDVRLLDPLREKAWKGLEGFLEELERSGELDKVTASGFQLYVAGYVWGAIDMHEKDAADRKFGGGS